MIMIEKLEKAMEGKISYKDLIIENQGKEIERLNNIIYLIKNSIDITIQIIKEQPTGNDEWILERLNGIKNIGEELKEGK